MADNRTRTIPLPALGLRSNDAPALIYVEDTDTDFSLISRQVRQHGFNVIRAHDHEELPQMLAAHPDAVGILSDVDTAPKGAKCTTPAGLPWANRYTHERGSKPVLLISSTAYEVAANRMHLPFQLKPAISEGHLLEEDPLTPAEALPKLRQRTRAFDKTLSDWLTRIKSTSISGNPDKSRC